VPLFSDSSREMALCMVWTARPVTSSISASNPQMCNIRHPTKRIVDRLGFMEDEIRFVNVELDGNDGLVVVFSDNTIAGYVPEELLKLRPSRESVEEQPATH
jgi:hypothetical protein